MCICLYDTSVYTVHSRADCLIFSGLLLWRFAAGGRAAVSTAREPTIAKTVSPVVSGAGQH